MHRHLCREPAPHERACQWRTYRVLVQYRLWGARQGTRPSSGSRRKLLMPCHARQRCRYWLCTRVIHALRQAVVGSLRLLSCAWVYKAGRWCCKRIFVQLCAQAVDNTNVIVYIALIYAMCS